MNDYLDLEIGFRRFKILLDIPVSGTTVTIPHTDINDDFRTSDPNNFRYDYTVDWGDGTIQQVTSWRDEHTIHTYMVEGEYLVQIYGFCDSFDCFNFWIKYNSIPNPSPYNNTMLPYIKKIVKFGNIFPKVFNLAYCVGLTEVKGDTKFSRRIKNTGLFNRMFFNCSSLTSIPEDIFKYNTNVTSFDETFSNCSSLTSIPEDIFKYNTNVTSFTGTFSDCTSLTSIPENLFKYNTNVTSFNGTFKNIFSTITSLPENLFINNLNVNSFAYCFMTEKPKPRGQLASVPVNMFNHLTGVTDVSYMFCNQKLSSVPNFNSFPSVANFNASGCFYDNPYMYGSQPSKWYNISNTYGNALFVGCFYNCINVTGYSTMDSYWKFSTV